MSRLLHLTNLLKAQANVEMLTPSQMAALATLSNHWRFPDRVNLCGPPGSGKTLLGWVLAYQFQVDFYASPQLFENDIPLFTSALIVDNAPSEEKKLRQLISEIQLRQLHKVLLITQKPNKIGLPTITLSEPTAEDVAKIYKNLSTLQFYPTEELANKNNLWKIIYSVL